MADVVPLDTSPKDGESISESRCARVFALEYGDTLKFCHTRGGWYEFDGSVWKFQETPIAFHYIRELAERLSIGAKNKQTIQKAAFVKGVEALSRADPVFRATAADWDTNLWLLGTPEGTVDLKTGELRSSVISDKITKSTAISPDDPEIVDCHAWLRFLDEVTGHDAELIRFLQQICGYALTGDISEQMLFFIFGPGGNGKGVFLRALQKIMGDYSVVAPMEALEKQKFAAHSTDLAMMQGARLVSASETDEGGEWNEKRIKALTGGDPITARFMNRNNTTFIPQLTLLVIGNHKPLLRTIDEAMRRRFNMIPFLVKPAHKDKRLDDKLQLEWPGILRWMISGCLDWQANGFVIASSVSQATETYFEEQDTFSAWLTDSCEVDQKNDHLIESSTALFKSWAAYAKANGVEIGNSKTFKPALERAGFKFKRIASGVHYVGLRIARAAFEPDHNVF